MGPLGCRYAALAIALLACRAPVSSPSTSDRALAASSEPAPDARATLQDGSTSPDAAPAPAPSSSQPVYVRCAGEERSSVSKTPTASNACEICPVDAPPEDECRRLRGSPADVHTPEGPGRGYEIHRHCPRWSAFPETIVIRGTGTQDFPQFGPASPSFGKRPPSELEAQFWAFARTVRAAAGISAVHSVGAGAECSDRSRRYSVILEVHDWRQVDQALGHLGSWLAAHDWNGDVVLWPSPIPGPGGFY